MNTENNKANLNKKALILSYITVGYNLAEGLLSIIFGLVSGSVALVGFGIDSFLESFSGSVMIWRFSNLNTESAKNDIKESKAKKLVGYSFIILGVYVLYESLERLYFNKPPDPTVIGIIIAMTSIITMPVLYVYKKKVGERIQSYSLIADARQTLACLYLSIALLLGLGLNYLFSLWWADPLAGVFIVGYLFKEGYETIYK